MNGLFGPASLRRALREGPARFGARLAAAIFLLDQATKLFVLFVIDIEMREPIRLLPFFDLVMVWNRGISYGMFQQENEFGRWALVAISIAASIGIGAWMLRAESRRLAFALALLLGGALGNLVDRIVYGAVADFIHLHWGDWSWYVFNIADAAIVAGVVLLLYDSFRGEKGGDNEA
jgi:signal peptidase II